MRLLQLVLHILGNLLDRGTAQAYIRECRDIHICWIHFLKANPNFDSGQVGDVKRHRDWVRKYNHTLKSLSRWL